MCLSVDTVQLLPEVEASHRQDETHEATGKLIWILGEGHVAVPECNSFGVALAIWVSSSKSHRHHSSYLRICFLCSCIIHTSVVVPCHIQPQDVNIGLLKYSPLVTLQLLYMDVVIFEATDSLVPAGSV